MQQAPNYASLHRRRTAHRLISLAAALALMAVSFTAGAVAFGREAVPVQETLELPEIGLTLLLPQSWAGKYDMVKTAQGNYVVFSPEIKAAWGGSAEDPFDGGVLFYVVLVDEVMTAEQAAQSEWNFAANRYLFATEKGTYLLYYASDVQFPPEMEEEYRRMEQGIGDIRIVVSGLLEAPSYAPII